ncbi:MAG: glutathione S-transferase [Myxococcales bacterium]|nr:glutathione S-transferase [Myxococcales bacterium]
MPEFVLYGTPGWGSAIVEAQLDWYGLDYRYELVGDLFASSEAREKLRAHNPILQVPTLVLPDGNVMSESAAITLHLADLVHRTDLVPGPSARERADFLRWLVFLVANIYPTFTYADLPERFVKTAGASAGFRAEVDAYAQRLWRVVEEAAGAPHFLGERFSALDVYLAVMTRWRPKRRWFDAETPKIAAIVAHADREPKLAAMITRNFAPSQ